MRFIYITFALSLAFLFSCKKDNNNTGTEYANEMYHSEAYEPLSQIVDKNNADYNSNPNNPYGMNMRKPVANTLKINKFTPIFGNEGAIIPATYHVNKDSFELSGRTLRNPLRAKSTFVADSTLLLEQGKVLYTNFCSHCHGETGQGDGTVGVVYKGVPSYSKGKVKTDTEGHIWHTITFGRNRMWSHASQINPEDRWKIVLYVQTLQNQE